MLPSWRMGTLLRSAVVALLLLLAAAPGLAARGVVARPAHPGITQPGGSIVVASSEMPSAGDALTEVDAQGREPTRILLSGVGSLSGPARSPDGRTIGYVLGGRAIWQLDVASGTRKRLYRLGGSGYLRLDGPRYSPDGRAIAFTDGCCGSFGIERIDGDGSGLQRLLGGEVRIFQDWSPDGRRILFTLNGKLWSAATDGTHATPLGGDAPDAGTFFGARYSPDGTHIAAALALAQGGNEAGGRQIVLMHADGRYLTQLTPQMPFEASAPTWSANGKWIAFLAASGAVGARGPLHDLWLMRYDGSRKLNLSLGRLGDVEGVAWGR